MTMEYRLLYWSSEDGDLVERLNELAAEGWEVVSHCHDRRVIEASYGAETDVLITIILKRALR